jgi:spore photoproduct lyase
MMGKTHDYSAKFESFCGRTLYESLPSDRRAFIKKTAFELRLTFQEFRRLAEIARDLDMWREPPLEQWWAQNRTATEPTGPETKKRLLHRLNEHVRALEKEPPDYGAAREREARPGNRPRKPVVTEDTDKSIWGMCPVASEKTVCCNLRTIDAVENCVFGCSYCTVQTFYTDRIVFDRGFADKLRAIDLDPDRFYHFGTGQASDSLAWGNKNGILDALCGFAASHPNILLEFKTKSDNVRYFIEHKPPENVVCSWSLNTPAVIENEEHFTADIDRRLAAARSVADTGTGVAFHFHPMVNYRGWKPDYTGVARRVMEMFEPAEVRFVSFGSVTLIKPVVRKMREAGHATRITQMEMVPDPHGKLTYTDDVKVEMFSAMFDTFAPWRNDVFLYLCMEKRSIWERSFGYAYDTNERFEAEFGRRTAAPRPGC